MDEDPLLGTIVRIPLSVVDKETSGTIKSCPLWLHVSPATYKASNDPKFVNVSITAVYQEGYFHTTITKDVIGNIFRKSSGIESEDYYSVITSLFPLDLETLIEVNSEESYKELSLSAKLVASSSDYDENQDILELGDSDPNKQGITITIKREGKLTVTVGSIDLPGIEFDKYDYLQEEGDLFNWLSLYNHQNKLLLDNLRDSKVEVETLKQENYLLEKNSSIAKKDFDYIIKDVESRFYQVLDSKKDKIWELTREQIPREKLVGLNQEFLEKEGKLNEIKREEIPDDIDKKYEKKRKKTPAKKVAKNRKTTRGRKKKVESDDEMETSSEDEDDDENTKESVEEDAKRTKTKSTRRRKKPVESDDNESEQEHEDDVSIKQEDDVLMSPEIKGEDSIKVKLEPESISYRLPYRSDRQILDDALDEEPESDVKDEAQVDTPHEKADEDEHGSDYNEGDDDYDEEIEEEPGDNNVTQPGLLSSMESADLAKCKAPSVVEDSLKESKKKKSQASQTSQPSQPFKKIEESTQGEETDYSEDNDDEEEEEKEKEVNTKTNEKNPPNEEGKSQPDDETDYSSDE